MINSPGVLRENEAKDRPMGGGVPLSAGLGELKMFSGGHFASEFEVGFKKVTKSDQQSKGFKAVVRLSLIHI